MRSAAASMVVLLAVSSGAAALANPLDEYGFGARAVGLAGAVSTLSDDFSSTYYNPAALAAGAALRIDLGYSHGEPLLDINGEDLEVDPSRGLQGGIVMQGRALQRRFAVAIGLFLPDERVSRIRALPQAQPRFELYDNRPQRVWINASAAAEVLPDLLYLGAGVTFLANTEGTLDIEGTVSARSVDRTKLFSAVDVDLRAVRYLSAGVLFTPGDRFRFAVVFRDEFSLDLDLRVKVTGDVVVGADDIVLVEDGLFELAASNHNLFSPRQVVFGAGWSDGKLAFAVDVAWLQWSRFPVPASTIDITLDLGDLDFAIPPPDPPADPGFHDIVVLRAGGELTVVDTGDFALAVRAGYFYEPSPAPDQPGATNYVDSDRHGTAVGLGFDFGLLPSVFPRPIGLDLAAQAVFLVRRTYVKSTPADPIGDFDAGGRILGAAATMSLPF